MSIFRSRDSEQPQTVDDLLAEARDDYARHNSAETRAADREQSGQTRTNGNAAGGFWRGRRS